MFLIDLIFSAVELILAHIIYLAVSYKVVSGEKIYEEYILKCYGSIPCSKQEAEKNGSYYYLPKKDMYYISSEDLFLEHYNFKLNKFYKIVMCVSFFLFAFPFCGERGESCFDGNIFMAMGAICLTLLSLFVCENVNKKCKEQHDVFKKLIGSRLPNVPLHILREESIDEIKKIIYRDSYEYAQSWLTEDEKKLMEVDKSNKLYYSKERFFLTNVIQNGFCLEPYTFYLYFPERDVDTQKSNL